MDTRIIHQNNRIVKIISIVTASLVFLLALGSFALSYNALQAVATKNGILGVLSYIWPLLIDASLIVFSLAVVNAHLQSESTWRQWLLVIFYTIGTISFNILHAPANLQAQIVAAIAPVSLFFSFELLMRQLKSAVVKHGAILSLNTIVKQHSEVSNEVDHLNTQVVKLQAQLSELEMLKINENTQKLDTLNSARKAKRQTRIDSMLNYMLDNPNASLTQVASEINASRQTVSNYVGELIEDGRLSKNGHGWRVTK